MGHLAPDVNNQIHSCASPVKAGQTLQKSPCILPGQVVIAAGVFFLFGLCPDGRRCFFSFGVWLPQAFFLVWGMVAAGVIFLFGLCPNGRRRFVFVWGMVAAGVLSRLPQASCLEICFRV